MPQFTPPTNFSKAKNPPAYSAQPQRQGTCIEAEALKQIEEEFARAARYHIRAKQAEYRKQLDNLLNLITSHEDTFTLKARFWQPRAGYLDPPKVSEHHVALSLFTDRDQIIPFDKPTGQLGLDTVVLEFKNVMLYGGHAMDELFKGLNNLYTLLPRLTNRHGQHPFIGFQRPNQVSIEEVIAHLPSEVVRVRVEDVTETIRPTRRQLLPGAE
jgi:hypothetical protein